MVSSPSILVVDDEPNSLFGICQVLTDEGDTIPRARGVRLEPHEVHRSTLRLGRPKRPVMVGHRKTSKPSRRRALHSEYPHRASKLAGGSQEDAYFRPNEEMISYI